MDYPFLTKEILEKLLANGSTENRDKDHFPVVKIFTPDAQATWLLTELLPDDTDTAYGLCDLGLGFPELGYVSLFELRVVRGHLKLPVERDEYFEAKYPLSVYAKAALLKGRITDDPETLEQAAKEKKSGREVDPPSPS